MRQRNTRETLETADPAGAPPVTWRPRAGRIVCYVMGTAIMITGVTLAIILPSSWPLSDRVGLVLFCLPLAGALYLLSRPRLQARPKTLLVVNFIHTRVLDWAEIVDVRMPEGEPWPTIDLASGATLAAMGIQSSDGARAHTALRELQEFVRERGEAAEPDGR